MADENQNLPKYNIAELRAKYPQIGKKWEKQEDENLKHIPVIMLTTSSSERDINSSYNHYANCYITKPVEVNEFLTVVSTIESFWVSIVKLPTNNSIQHDKG